MTDEAIRNCPIKDICLDENIFIKAFKTFLYQIADQVDHVWENLHEKSMLRNFNHITQSQFEKFVKLTWERYERTRIVPGEACGAVAAQSIGEPAT